MFSFAVARNVMVRITSHCHILKKSTAKDYSLSNHRGANGHSATNIHSTNTDLVVLACTHRSQVLSPKQNPQWRVTFEVTGKIQQGLLVVTTYRLRSKIICLANLSSDLVEMLAKRDLMHTRHYFAKADTNTHLMNMEAQELCRTSSGTWSWYCDFSWKSKIPGCSSRDPFRLGHEAHSAPSKHPRTHMKNSSNSLQQKTLRRSRLQQHMASEQSVQNPHFEKASLDRER